uniref:sensor histidine kinase n=1 Tax=uncultured Draconibacterium sp. TaxID=1573823 RepID=UPI003217F988
MKILLPFLFLFGFTFNCEANENEDLTKATWRAIVETYNTKHSRHWENDITIKLFGNYSAADSVMVANSIKQLNALCETIQIGFSELDRGNLEIFYLDSVNYLSYKPIISLKQDIKSSWRYTHLNTNAIGLFKLALNNSLIPEEFNQNYLTNMLAFALYPAFWRDKEYDENECEDNEICASIFRLIPFKEREKLYLKEMQSFDKRLLREIYSKNFNEKLDKALEQYPTMIKVPGWLRANARAFLLLPVIILLLLLLPFYMKITKIIAQKVPNKFVSFNCSGIIGVLVLAVIGSLYFSASDAVKFDVFSLETILLWSREIFLAVLIISMPAINILRFIELLIHKNTDRKILKIVLIFLSTGLIPFAALVVFAMIANKHGGKQSFSKQEIEILAYIFIACITVASFRALMSYFFFKEKDLILENETKLSNLRELKTKAELNALHSRINPHFLYNSLNSIAGLAHINADKTEHMALSLSKLFRYSINKEKSDWTTFKEELEMVRIYLDVEKVRFDDRLTFSVEIDKELEEQKIPRFIIQPLVENAVKHGISKSLEGGEIKIKIAKDKKATIIAVSDSGQAFPMDFAPGFGIQSIYDKLEILYKNKFEMSFTNTPQKQVILRLK